LISSKNILFNFHYLLNIYESFNKKTDISTNLKHSTGWKFLGCKKRASQGKKGCVVASSKNKYVRWKVSIVVVLISQISGI
jgi:hypothetical protein